MSRTAEQRVLRMAKDWRKHHDLVVEAYANNRGTYVFDLMTDAALMYAVDALVESQKRERRSKALKRSRAK